jgi:hypothetical protein
MIPSAKLPRGELERAREVEVSMGYVYEHMEGEEID